MTSEHDITENLLDYYLAHGLKHIARRFRLKAEIIANILSEAGVSEVPARDYTPRPQRRKYTPRARLLPDSSNLPLAKRVVNTVPRGANSLSGFTRLTDEQKAKLRAEYVPGKPLENSRLAKKYNTSSAWVSQLTADLRG